MKKVLALLILGITVVVLSGCSLLDSDTLDGGNLFSSKENVIGFSALSSVMTLHDETNQQDTQASSGMFLNTEMDDTLEILSEIDELTPFLDLISTFMGDGSTFDVSVETSGFEDYEHTMIISTLNMQGEVIQYTMHYNETIIDEDDDEDQDYDEYDSVLEGIMIIDGVTYTLYGEREVDEGEESLELIASLDDENYVTLEYEVEVDGDETETEFVYEMFINNQLVKRIEIEFEQDNEETELEIKFVKGLRESEYSFEVEIDGNERTIEIEYKITEDGQVIEEGEAEVSIVYNAETGENVVRYEIEREGQKIIIDDDYDTPVNDDDNDNDNDDDEEDDEEDDDEEDDEVEGTSFKL